jgi:hypothetical protein
MKDPQWQGGEMADFARQQPFRPPGSQNQGLRGEQTLSLKLPEPAFVFQYRAPERERPLAELPSDKLQNKQLESAQIEKKLKEKREEELEELEVELADVFVREVIVDQIEPDHAGRKPTNGHRTGTRRPTKKRRPATKSKSVTAKKKSRKPGNSTKKVRA